MSNLIRCLRPTKLLSALPMIFLIIASTNLYAESKPEKIAGHWEGQIQLPGATLAIKFDFEADEDVHWSGTIDIPAQGLRAFRLSDLKVGKTKISFKMPAIPGDPQFDGTLSADGEKIAGTFKQNGQQYPFEIVRKEPTAPTAFPKPSFVLEKPHLALEAIRVAHGLPGLGAAIVTDKGLHTLVTVGVRKKGDQTPVTDHDLWHLGSCGKAMTATMIARLVEAGKIKFEQTLGETFPEHAEAMSDQLKSVKLIHLLSHRSGLPANFNLQAYLDEPDVALARDKVLLEAMSKPLLSEPGEKYLYSNWGYTLAGHMAEKATGKTWETLMKTEVFEPLQMMTGGFGGTGTQGKIDQPWPHASNGSAMPSNGKEMDNLPVMGPAGTIHMSLEDWGKFITEHLKGAKGKSEYLAQASFQRLHTAIGKDYAMGWMPRMRPWAGGTALFHNGDNTLNHAVVWAAPEKGFAVLVVTNQSLARIAADEVAAGLITAWQSRDASSQNLTDEWIEKAAAPLVENRIADGLSVGYLEGKHWGIVHLGTSNRAKKKADNRTVYEIGSMSKVFTGLLLADAVVRGEIDLNATADVANAAGIRLPSRNGRSIKWIDLSTHRSGLPRLPGNLRLTNLKNPYRAYDSKKAATFLNQYELPRQPGDSREYSNFGVSVLGYLVAQNAGKTYQQLLRERIATPLRMTDCTVSLSRDQRKRLALPHDKYGSATALWTFADLPGAGGVHATMRDMMRFARAQLTPPTGTLGKVIELAWKQQRDADASGPAMGLGWVIHRDGQTRWHNGQTGGFHSAIFINRKSNCAVVVLCNTAVTNEIDQLAMQLIRKAAGQEVKPEPSEDSDHESGDLAIDSKLRRRLVGRYQLTPDFIFTVRDRDGHLMVGITNQATQEVYPDSPTRWSYRGVDATLEFKLTKTGPAKSLVLHQDGNKQTARRIR